MGYPVLVGYNVDAITLGSWVEGLDAAAPWLVTNQIEDIKIIDSSKFE